MCASGGQLVQSGAAAPEARRGLPVLASSHAGRTWGAGGCAPGCGAFDEAAGTARRAGKRAPAARHAGAETGRLKPKTADSAGMYADLPQQACRRQVCFCTAAPLAAAPAFAARKGKHNQGSQFPGGLGCAYPQWTRKTQRLGCQTGGQLGFPARGSHFHI